MRDIAFLKTQLVSDFETNKTLLNEMLKTPGFSQYLKNVLIGKHDALIAFLEMFSNNMTVDIRKAIVDAGTDPQLPDRIVAYATPFYRGRHETGKPEICQQGDTFGGD